MDATLFPHTSSIHAGLEAAAAAFVFGLVELTVDNVLEHDEQDTDEDREEGDANVCLEVPFLQCIHGIFRRCLWNCHTGKKRKGTALTLLHVDLHSSQLQTPKEIENSIPNEKEVI